MAFVGISDGLGTFEALVNILGDGKATSARLADLKAATEAARQAKADAVAKQQKAEAALENLAAEERRSEASSREQTRNSLPAWSRWKLAKSASRKPRLRAQAHLDRAKQIKSDAEDRWRKFSA